MPALHLEIVTPDKLVLSTEVDYVGAPGVDGEFGILPHHIPLLSALAVGELYYKNGSKKSWAFISGGFLEVNDNKISILAQAAELAHDIDENRAESAKKRAESYLQASEEDIDKARARKALDRAELRLQIALLARR